MTGEKHPTIALNDLQRHTRPLAAELTAAMERVAASGWYIMGGEVATFEREFAAYCGAPECIGLANGTDALEIALRAVGVGIGDKVAMVGNAGSYGTIATGVIGAKALYVDIEPKRMLMSPARLEAADLTGVKAIIATHLYGQLCEIEAIAKIAAKRSIPLIEDCAQSVGARRRGKLAGSFGALGTYSFYPTKNLGAMGDGGAIVTTSGEIAARVKQLRQYGWSKKYLSTLAGGRNSRLDEMQAAVLRAKLPHLDAWNERRRAIVARYASGITHPRIRIDRAADESDVAHLFVLRAEGRDALAAHCKANGVGTDVHYPNPDYVQPAMESKAQAANCPETTRACAEVLSLPCYPELTDEEVDTVIRVVNAWRP